MLPCCERVVTISRAHYLPARNRGIPIPKQPTTIGGHLRKRRLQLQIHQSEAASRLGVSTVTLSRWECDKVYPTWDHHLALIAYLRFDPFTSSGLRDPFSNETPVVASSASATLGERIRIRRLELKLTVKNCAKKLNIDEKTLHGWEKHRHTPARGMLSHILKFLAGSEPD